MFDQLLMAGGEHTWVAQVFLIVFIALLGNLVVRVCLRRLRVKLKTTPNIWDDTLVAAVQGPATLLVWVVGFTFAADVVRAETQAPIFNAIDPLRQLGIISAITWFLMRLVQRLQRNVVARRRLEGKTVDVATADAVGKLLRASILITAGLVALQTLGFSISGVLAFGGIGGIALGFAAKDVLANFFGGLMLYLDRPFAVGDWVRSPDREIEGTVEDIGWRLTRIRGFDMRPIYIPNGAFSTMSIVNPSRMTHRRIYETIGIRYQDADKMAAIVAEVEAMIAAHAEIDQSQVSMVNFNAFAPSSLDFFVYAYTHTTGWIKFHQVKQDILLKINAIIAAHNAEIAFPTSTLHLPEAARINRDGDGGGDRARK